MPNEESLWSKSPAAVSTTAPSALVASFGPAAESAKLAISQADPLRLAVAKLLCFAPGHSKPIGAATGVFISDEVLLTAGHVLFNVPLFGGYAAAIQIWSPWYPIPPAASVSKWIVVPPAAEKQAKPPPELDVGIIRLNAAVPGIVPMHPVAANDANLNGAQLRIYGYSAHENQLHATPALCAGGAPQLIYYDANVEPGDSGSPIFAATPNGPALVGLHRAGPGEVPEDPNLASGFRLTAAAISWIQETLDKFGD